MKKCHECIFYREERSLYASLIHKCASYSGMGNVLNSLLQTEMNLRSNEKQHLMMLVNAGTEIWPFRPIVSSYCGVEEKLGIFSIAEVKNRKSDCKDYQTISRKLLRSCASCKYLAQPQGYQQDHGLKLDILRQGTLTQGMDGYSDPSKITQQIDILMNTQTNRMSLEVTEAMHGSGKLSYIPTYFNWCRRLSNARNFVLCDYENHDGRCFAWKKR